MSLSSHCFQTCIPESPEDPSRPFMQFGWPLILCGHIGNYSYPEHFGPLSVNFCFDGVLSATCGEDEYNSDSSSFCVVNRNKPTRIQALASRRARQIAFFYSRNFLARFLTETSLEVETTQDAEAGRFFEHDSHRRLLALPNCTLPLYGEVEQFARACCSRLMKGDSSDAEAEEMHAELLMVLCQRYHLAPYWFIDLENHKPHESREVKYRLEMSFSQIVLDPVTPKGLEDRASEAGLPKFRYLRLFKARFGITPGQFVVLQKIRLARLMLKSRRFSVEQVSHALGYRSWSNFARVFRQNVGVTPKEYQMLPFTKKLREDARRQVEDCTCLRAG